MYVARLVVWVNVRVHHNSTVKLLMAQVVVGTGAVHNRAWRTARCIGRFHSRVLQDIGCLPQSAFTDTHSSDMQLAISRYHKASVLWNSLTCVKRTI